MSKASFPNGKGVLLDGNPVCTLPVGIYILLDDGIEPGDLYGGTWKQVEQGRFLLSAGSSYKAGSTGGSSTHSHTLNNGYALAKIAPEAAIYAKQKDITNIETLTYALTSPYYGTGSWPVQTVVCLGGSSDSATTTQPYLAVNIWRRIS